MIDTRTQILDAAERFIRTGGYNHGSFRDIAAEIGIKSASVHHHFPGKADLAAAVAARYAERFFAALGEACPPQSESPARVRRYCGVFRDAFAAGGKACLCGVLSGEAALLPAPVQAAVADFVDANVAWLERALTGPTGRIPAATTRRARCIYAALQGAMAVAAVRAEPRWLEDVIADLTA